MDESAALSGLPLGGLACGELLRSEQRALTSEVSRLRTRDCARRTVRVSGGVAGPRRGRDSGVRSSRYAGPREFEVCVSADRRCKL